MEYLKANGTEIPAQVCGKQIDRDWDGRASRTVTLTMAYAQAAQLFVDGLNWAIVRRGDDAHGTAQEPGLLRLLCCRADYRQPGWDAHG